tara:strand:- start:3348 stop:4067 length:720 start_codon:yes stop_codon:yes gene_type:complete
MKCLVWNMDHWKRSQEQREKAWKFIQSLEPELCLLNECIDHPSQPYSIHSKDTGAWGTGVFSKYALSEITSIDKGKKTIPLSISHPGALVPCELTIGKQEIIAISLYGKIDKSGYATTTLHRSLSDLTPLLDGQRKKTRWLIIGGDFNADPLIDKQQRNSAHHIFYERLKDFKLYDCCKKFNTERVQTNRSSRSKQKWENDRLFAGKDLYDRLISCEVIDDSALYELSDHNPIIAEFDI